MCDSRADCKCLEPNKDDKVNKAAQRSFVDAMLAIPAIVNWAEVRMHTIAFWENSNLDSFIQKVHRFSGGEIELCVEGKEMHEEEDGPILIPDAKPQ